LEAGEVLRGGLGEEEDTPQALPSGLDQRPAGEARSEAPAAVVRVYGQGAEETVGAVAFDPHAARQAAAVSGQQEGVQVVGHAVERQAAEGEQLLQRG
jgi:hypothetical protein